MNLSEVIRKENEDIKQGGIRNPPHTKVGSLKNKRTSNWFRSNDPNRSSMDPKTRFASYLAKRLLAVN